MFAAHVPHVSTQLAGQVFPKQEPLQLCQQVPLQLARQVPNWGQVHAESKQLSPHVLVQASVRS